MLAFPPNATHETIAAYYLHGIEVGLFESDCAKDWAYSLVESQESPHISIIDVASANRRAEAISALSFVAHGGDLTQAGIWLLEFVLKALRRREIAVAVAASAAHTIAYFSPFPKDVFFWLTSLDDGDDFASAESTIADALAEIYLLHPPFCGAV